MRAWTRLRATRTRGEIADWVELVGARLQTTGDGVTLVSGPAARMLVRLCGASAVTLGNMVLFSSTGWLEILRRSDAGLLLLAHELVHIGQYRSHGVVGFLRVYVREYLEGRLRGLSHWQSYRAISFEREARLGESLAAGLLSANALLRGEPVRIDAGRSATGRG